MAPSASSDTGLACLDQRDDLGRGIERRRHVRDFTGAFAERLNAAPRGREIFPLLLDTLRQIPEPCPEVATALQDLLTAVGKQVPLNRAMLPHSECFPLIYRHMVDVGMRECRLAQAMQNIRDMPIIFEEGSHRHPYIENFAKAFYLLLKTGVATTTALDLLEDLFPTQSDFQHVIRELVVELRLVESQSLRKFKLTKEESAALRVATTRTISEIMKKHESFFPPALRRAVESNPGNLLGGLGYYLKGRQ